MSRMKHFPKGRPMIRECIKDEAFKDDSPALLKKKWE
jgi:hypothetical protein